MARERTEVLRDELVHFARQRVQEALVHAVDVFVQRIQSGCFDAFGDLAHVKRHSSNETNLQRGGLAALKHLLALG